MLDIEKIANNIRITEEKESDFKARYIVEPMYRGYGNTVGNSIRRVLLSSIPGAAIKGMRIEGVLNEFSTVEGIQEAVTDIILNVKAIVVKKDIPGDKTVTLSVRGPKVVTGADINPDSEVTIINPEQVIATITKDMEFNVEFVVGTGEGFVVAEDIEKENWPIGYLAVDAIYSPIRKVSYKVEDTMVGRITNFDKLVMDVESDGSVTLKDAMSYAIELLMKHFSPFLEIGNRMENLRESADEAKEEVKESGEAAEKDVENMKIDELDLTVRSYNCLKKAQIETVGQLAKLGLPELLKIKNLGRKSLTEIMEKMKDLGFDLSSNGAEE